MYKYPNLICDLLASKPGYSYYRHLAHVSSCLQGAVQMCVQMKKVYNIPAITKALGKLCRKTGGVNILESGQRVH